MNPALAAFTLLDASSAFTYLTVTVALFFLLAELQREGKLRKIREAQFETERRFRALFEQAPIAFLEVDEHGHLTRVNRSGCAMFGCSPDEMIGRPAWEFLAPEQREVVRESMLRQLTGACQSSESERVFVRKDGTRVHLEVHESLVKDGEGRVSGIRMAAIDRTERVQSEETIAEFTEMLRKKNQELEKALAAARSAAEMKSRFLANVNHEVRTPMNGVLGMTELLLGTDLDQEQREYAETVKRSADSLLTLLNDILSVSKMESGEYEVESAPFDLNQVLQDVRAAIAARAAMKGLETIFTIGGDVPSALMGDPSRLREILTKLARNAVKFTEQGSVTVSVALVEMAHSSATLRFSVRDTGIGIPREYHGRIFQSFTQVDDSSTRRYGGSGLGLTIVMYLVEFLGGEISIDSEPGKGSNFLFALKFAVASKAVSAD